MTRFLAVTVAVMVLAGSADAQYPRPKLMTAEGKRVGGSVEYVLTFDKALKKGDEAIGVAWATEVTKVDNPITETVVSTEGKTATVTFKANGFSRSAALVTKLEFKSATKDGAVYEMEVSGPYYKTKQDAFSAALARLDAQTRYTGKEAGMANLGVNYAGDEKKGTITLAYRAKK